MKTNTNNRVKLDIILDGTYIDNDIKVADAVADIDIVYPTGVDDVNDDDTTIKVAVDNVDSLDKLYYLLDNIRGRYFCIKDIKVRG